MQYILHGLDDLYVGYGWKTVQYIEFLRKKNSLRYNRVALWTIPSFPKNLSGERYPDFLSGPTKMSENEMQIEKAPKTRETRGRGHNSKKDSKSSRYSGKSGIFERLDAPDGVKSVEGYILFVTGVHEEAQEDDVVDKFSDIGDVKNIHVNLDRRTGFVKGYALVEFETLAEAKLAIKELDGESLLGETIHVDWAFQKGKKSGGKRR